MQSEHQGPPRAVIRPVKDRVEDDLLSRDGVVGVDIAEKITNGTPTGQLSIVVFVQDKVPSTALRTGQAVPAQVQGIATDVQELAIELQVAAPQREAVEALVDTAHYTPLVGGISMGPARSVYLAPPDVPLAGKYTFSGTFGAIVKDRAGGGAMALTNFHVACVESTWKVGDRMVQPSRPDGTGTPGEEYGALDRAVLSDDVDGAVVRLDQVRRWSPRVADIGYIPGAAVAAIGMDVQKRGRTTKHSFGRVVSTDATVLLNYGNGLGWRTLRRQIRVETDTSRSVRFSAGGDSGSVVMATDRRVVGMLFAGSTDGRFSFANPLQAVLDQLGVDLAVARQPVLRRPDHCWPTRPTVLCPGDAHAYWAGYQAAIAEVSPRDTIVHRSV